MDRTSLDCFDTEGAPRRSYWIGGIGGACVSGVFRAGTRISLTSVTTPGHMPPSLGSQGSSLSTAYKDVVHAGRGSLSPPLPSF